MNSMMYIQIIICLIIIIIVVANPAATGNGLEGLMGNSSEKKNKNGRLRKADKNFLLIIFLFFSVSFGFSMFSQNPTTQQLENNHPPLKNLSEFNFNFNDVDNTEDDEDIDVPTSDEVQEHHNESNVIETQDNKGDI